MGGHARDELTQPKGLRDIVVGSDLEGHHGVDLVRSRAHHDHRHPRVHLAQLPADVETGDVWKRHLEQYDAGPGRLDLAECLGARVGLDDLVTVLLAGDLDLAPRRVVRFHDQDLAGGLRHSHPSILIDLKDC